VFAGVLIDFSGTLFRIESAEQAVHAALGPELVSFAPELRRLGAINGSSMPETVSGETAELWARRDLSAAAHRAAYRGQSLAAGLSDEQADALYVRGISPDAWQPYPDTVRTLRALRAADVPVAVVSNIGWDPRPVFRRFGVEQEPTVFVLSDERGVQKPDPEIFRIACAELDRAPADCLMIGDDEGADGGCRALGIEFRLVPSALEKRTDDTLWVAAGLSG
jgi:putative hydrolase of the HAD superfamily